MFLLLLEPTKFCYQKYQSQREHEKHVYVKHFSHSCYMYITGDMSTDFSRSNTMEMKLNSCNTMQLKSKSDDLQSIYDVDHKSESCGIESSTAEIENEKPPITGTIVARCIYLGNSFMVN